MIELNIQMFAKSAAWQSDRRKSKAYANGIQIQEEIKKEEEKKPVQEKKPAKPAKGEAVNAVSTRETYAIYRVENGKETPVVKDGIAVTRTGKQILDKMVFNKRRGLWENSQGRTYRVRKTR